MTPVVVTVRRRGREPGAAVLADVIVVDPRIIGSPAPLCADLFARYPGLTLVVLRRGTTPWAGIRDGTLLRLDPPDGGGLRRLARTLYASWCATGDPAGWRVDSARPASWRHGPARACVSPPTVRVRVPLGTVRSPVEVGKTAPKRCRPW